LNWHRERAGIRALGNLRADTGQLGDVAGGHVDTVARALRKLDGVGVGREAASSLAEQGVGSGFRAGAVLVSAVLGVDLNAALAQRDLVAHDISVGSAVGAGTLREGLVQNSLAIADEI